MSDTPFTDLVEMCSRIKIATGEKVSLTIGDDMDGKIRAYLTAVEADTLVGLRNGIIKVVCATPSGVNVGCNGG